MKLFSAVLLAGAFAFPTLAQNSATNAAAAVKKIGPPVAVLPASAAVLSGPMVLTNGYISQPQQTELAEGGKAIFNFTLTNAGTFVIKGVVYAADESMNSFYLNIDEAPQDPLMIWDMEVTNGFEEKTVSWRGNGDANNDEIAPKRFQLSAGAHKLILVGREPTQLKSISICPEVN